jgi:hypothetical protein
MNRVAVFLLAATLAAGASGCRKKDPEQPAVATPSVTLNHDRAPLGSPLDITYKWTVANDAKFDEDFRVMMHVMDTDGEMIWNDDHNPEVPTRQWKPGETYQYSRTVFVPIYPYVGEATIEVGLYSVASQKRLTLNGETTGQRAYKVAKLQLQPQTENLPSVFKEGWHPAEVAENNQTVQWQWTKKDATFTFKNPKKDVTFFFDVDNPGSVLKEPQDVQLTVNGLPLTNFTLEPGKRELKRIPIKADQLGSSEMVELQIGVDKSYVPALTPGANSKDPRELGVRVFHAFVDPR